MSSEDEVIIKKRPRRRLVGFWMLLSIALLIGLLGLAGMSVSGRPLTAPDWITAQIAKRVNGSLTSGRLTIGRMQLRVAERGIPGIHMQNVGVFDGRGAEIARLNDVGVNISLPSLLRGQIRADVVRLSGAQMTIRRRADGQFALSFGGGAGTTGTMSGVLDAFDQAFAVAPLNAVEKLEADDLTISVDDARSGRLWQITEGHLQITNLSDGLDIAVDFDVFNGTEELAETVVGIQTQARTSAASFGTTFHNAAAADIALQSPVLSFLGVLNAPIAGALRADFGDDGVLSDLAGTLEIGAGALQPTSATKPVGFASGKSYFRYDPLTEKLTFSEVSVETDAASVIAQGHAYLRDYKDGWPSTFLAQFTVSDLVVDPEDLFVEPVTYSHGATDFRVRLNPFSIEFGQLVLSDGDERLQAKGIISAGQKGWELAGDIDISQIKRDRLLAVWPASFIPKTRDWFADNVSGGVFSAVRAGARLKPEQTPKMSLGFQFQDTAIRYIKSLPEIKNATGYSTINGKTFTLVLEKGEVAAPKGGDIDITGSSMQIVDVTRIPARADLKLVGASSATATLSLLNEPPFSVLRNTELPVDLADGRLNFGADVTFDLKGQIGIDDVSYQVDGTLQNMSSDKLVTGRTLKADRLSLLANNGVVEISGPGALGQATGEMTWQQKMGADGTGKSSVAGTVELSQAFVDEFGIGLPKGSVSGAGVGQFDIRFQKDQPPTFTLTSDLNRVGISIPAIGWSKALNATGKLDVAGSLGEQPYVSLLELTAPGLTATGGSVTLNEEGGLGTAAFERVKAGAWLDAPVALTGRGASQSPAVRVTGGTIDVRETSFGGGSDSSGATSGPIELALDRVTISEGITLTGFTGSFENSGGLAGSFNARVNGKTRVNGRLAPEKNGTAVRIQSKNAGGVFRNAGVLANAAGGDMDMTLRPLARNGFYRGDLTVANTRIVDAPALTELLNAISIVGLIDQMSGPGISFAEVDANFTLSPSSVQLHRSSATGPSLGVSLDGIYDLTNSRMNMQGVISPVYFLNGLGQIVSPRRGEGLFGFNFRLTGTADSPDVTVNPLSILTPGIFRDIFRRPAPKPTQ